MDKDRDTAETPPRETDESVDGGVVHTPEALTPPEHDHTPVKSPDEPIALGTSSSSPGGTEPHDAGLTGDGTDPESNADAVGGVTLVAGPQRDRVPGDTEPLDADASSSNEGERDVDEQTAGSAPPLLSTTCPVCGQTTPANRFCGYCGAPLTEERPHATGRHGDPVLRLTGRVHDTLFPSTQPIDMRWHRIVVGVAVLIALIALLTNDIGIALIATAAIAPVLLILTLRQLDVFERESPLLAAGAAVAGVIGGLIIGGIMSWATRQWWFSTGGFNHGAAGYGAEFAKRAGNAPFLLLLINGILLPAVGVAAMLLGPIALRRFNQFRNEAMDGLALGALGGAGYVLGTVVVFVLPEVGGAGPTLSVRHWTLLVLGLTLFRPLIVTAGAAIFAAGLWRFMMTERSSVLIVPAVAGVGGIVLLYLGTMILEPRSLGLEVGWNLLLAVVLIGVLSLVLRQSIAFDRRILGANDTRVTCPSCGQVTPRGAYCAHCGQPLPAADAA